MCDGIIVMNSVQNMINSMIKQLRATGQVKINDVRTTGGKRWLKRMYYTKILRIVKNRTISYHLSGIVYFIVIRVFRRK